MNNNELEKLKICNKCINEPYLSSEITKKGTKNKCYHCGFSESTITLGELADYVNWSFKNYYRKDPFEPVRYKKYLIWGKEIEFDMHQGTELATKLIEENTKVKAAIALDLQKILFYRYYSDGKKGIETEFNPKSRYANKTPNISELETKWDDFKFDLQSKSRYFGDSASNFLNMIFEKLEDLECFFQPALIVEAGPDLEMNEFYRARCFEVKEDLLRAMEAPDKELGPPPSDRGVGGRMNSPGISVFYGSNNAEVALAEIRPPVGSYVLVGKFRLIRRLRLLNLLEKKTSHTVISYFDPNFLDLFKRAIFLQKLATKLSRPVLPSVAEPEYLPTQVISDYLANKLEPTFDDILFPSTQVASSGSRESDTVVNTNVVLFNKSSKVRDIGHKYKAGYLSFDEVGTHYFSVDVESSKETFLREDKDRRRRGNTTLESDLMYSSNLRPDTLEVDRRSLWVHIVDGMVVNSDSHPVYWDGVSEVGNIEA